MKILYDCQTYNNNRFGGIARYHYELANGLKDFGDKTEISSLFTPSEYLLKDKKYKLCNPLGYNNFKGRYRLNLLIEKINKYYSVERIKSKKFDLFHPTYYDPYFLDYLEKPFVVTVHDFVHEKFDRLRVQDIANKKLLIEKSVKIIAVSENTKKDILEHYDTPEEKIQVIYHGVHKNRTNYLSNPYGEYILYIGDRYGYKNFKLFLEAIFPLLKLNENLHLVCTGCPFSEEELNLLESHNVSNQVFQKPANEQELNSLYKHALVFVSPSLYEGFGIPILEAFSNDCPICISHSSSYPEIAGDAAVYFDPLSSDSILAAVESVIKSKSLRNRLIEMGQKRVKDFSWEKTVKETRSLYYTIV